MCVCVKCIYTDVHACIGLGNASPGVVPGSYAQHNVCMNICIVIGIVSPKALCYGNHAQLLQSLLALYKCPWQYW